MIGYFSIYWKHCAAIGMCLALGFILKNVGGQPICDEHVQCYFFILETVSG
jgi:hypothetical protein